MGLLAKHGPYTEKMGLPSRTLTWTVLGHLWHSRWRNQNFQLKQSVKAPLTYAGADVAETAHSWKVWVATSAWLQESHCVTLVHLGVSNTLPKNWQTLLWDDNGTSGKNKQELSLHLLITWQLWGRSISRLGEGKEEFSTHPCTCGTATREANTSSRSVTFQKWYLKANSIE